MSVRISHQAELQEKRYQSPTGVVFLKIGAMSYAPEMFVHTDLRAASRVQLGKYCSIAETVNFFPNAEHDTAWVSTYPFVHCANAWPEMDRLTGHPFTRGDIVVGHDVWIGYGAMIRSGVTIGNGAVIGMGSVVVKDVPSYAIAVGNPARVLRYRFEPSVIEKLTELAWWDWPIPVVRENAHLLNSAMDEAVLTRLEKLAGSLIQG